MSTDIERVCPHCEGYGNHLGTAGDRSNPPCSECQGTGKYVGLYTYQMEIPVGPSDLRERIRGGWLLTWDQLNELINADARTYGYPTYYMSPEAWIEMGWIVRMRDGDYNSFYVHTRDIEPLLEWARKYDAKKRIMDAKLRLGDKA